MTGADLIKWIQDNHAENLEVYAMDDGCGLYNVHECKLVTDDHYKWPQEETYILLDE